MCIKLSFVIIIYFSSKSLFVRKVSGWLVVLFERHPCDKIKHFFTWKKKLSAWLLGFSSFMGVEYSFICSTNAVSSMWCIRTWHSIKCNRRWELCVNPWKVVDILCCFLFFIAFMQIFFVFSNFPHDQPFDSYNVMLFSLFDKIDCIWNNVICRTPEKGTIDENDDTWCMRCLAQHFRSII